MNLIIGGAYQGKLEYARKEFGVKTVWDCSEGEPDFSCDAVCGLEKFVRSCTESGMEAAQWLEARRSQWQERVLIITDVSQGIVPMDAQTRAFREMNGRTMLYLAGQADRVDRVFCGIGKQIK